MRQTRIALLCTLLAMAGIAKADWVDVTNIFIENPRFDNNSDYGWSKTSDAWSQTLRCETMEFWNGTFNLWQDLKNLPKGKYRLSVQAYYRTGDNDPAYAAYRNGTEKITAYLYAGQQKTQLVSVYSYQLPYWVDGCWTYNSGWPNFENRYFPNTMESAAVAFGNGAYQNHLEFETEGNVRIGLINEVWANSNWCIFDNFRLEFSGEIVQVQQVSLTAGKTDIIVGETTQCVATVEPANALQKALTWKSDNAAVATVDNEGLVTGISTGTAKIIATTTDGSNLSATVAITVKRNDPTAESLIINEIMASNVDEFISPAFNFDGWIELYNPTSQAVSLSGLYISDDDTNLKQWQLPADFGILPAKGYKIVWFDSNNIARHQAPFKLDVDGGTIYISDATGKLLTSQSYPESMERVSYARTTDGGNEWKLTSTATPGTSNAAAVYASAQLAAPVVDQPSQLFSGSLVVNVSIPSGTTLRYTLDGSLPTLSNGDTNTTGKISITATTNLRLRLFADGKLASPVTTRSYIRRDKNYMLPVVSVVGDWRFFYDDSIGVCTQGVNGRPGNGQNRPCNWNMDWERPVNFSYLTADGEMVLNQDVDLEMCGGWSRAWEPHSFKLKGNKEFGGNKNLLYPFFDQKPYIRNRTLQIRNGGNDTQARLKDPALQYIVQTSGIDIDGQAYQPVHEFINGKYIGVLNVREPNNKHYVYANYGWDDDEIDQFEMSPDSGYVQKCGTPDAYNELVDVLSPDAANSETYAEICAMLDIDAYANYMAAQMYLGNTDWPQNNVKGFRHRDDGRFRFVLFDLDHAFNTNDSFNQFMWKETYTFDQLYPHELGRITAQIRFVTLFKNLLKNADFRRKFIDAYCIMGGSVFEATRAADLINELANRVNPAMALENSSVNSTANTLRSNLSGRLGTATNALRSYSAFNLGSVTPQRVTLDSDAEGAQLMINGMQVPTGRFNGNLFAPVRLRAVAPAGYVFLGWLKSGTQKPNYYATDEEIAMPKDNNLKLTACFRALSQSERLAQGVTPIRINEVSGSNDSYINEYGKKNDWVELYNTTDEEVDIEGMYLTDNLDKPTKYQITKEATPAQTRIPAHGHLLIWCDKLETTSQALHASFKIDGDGGVLALTAADRSWTDTFYYGAHDANQTVGRYPDGGVDIYMMSMPTIAKANRLSSYAVKTGQESVGIHHAQASTGNFRICYGNQQIIVKGENVKQALVKIYTTDGRLVEQAQVELNNGTARLDVSHLPAGFYIAQADGQQVCVSCKFMK